MKVGIFTFHCAHNYGAVLQAYALQQYLSRKGFEVCIVDYRPEYLVRPYKVLDICGYFSDGLIEFLKTLISKLFLLPKTIHRRKGFERFIRNRLNIEYLDLSSSNNDFDVFVFGSDQIWNPKLCKGLDPVYFGDFYAARGKLLISYAASMGGISLKEDDEIYLKGALEKFVYISVRERSLQQYLVSLTQKNVSTVMDPTFLLDSLLWNEIAVKPVIDNPYVLLYQVLPNKEAMRIARQIANQIGGTVIELKAYLSLTHQTPYQCASPEEFLGLFKYASCVVTTSFHGTAFSLIFNRNFYVVRLTQGMNTRSESLLQDLNLLNRMVESADNLAFSQIDYSIVNPMMQVLIKQSESFLWTALGRD